jgi:hypothetical protein
MAQRALVRLNRSEIAVGLDLYLSQFLAVIESVRFGRVLGLARKPWKVK